MGRRTLILLLVLTFFVYVGVRIASGIGAVATTVLILILFGGLLGYRTIHGLKTPWVRRVLLTAVHLEMAFLSFVLAFILIRDLIFFPLSYWSPEVSDLAFGLPGTLILFALAVLFLALGVFIAWMGPRIIRVTIPIANLPAEFEGFSIAQISDLHVGPSTASAFVSRVVERTLGLNPSMVALTGDIGDGNLQESSEALKPLGRLAQAPHGAYYVTGNHEFYWNGPSWIEAFTKLGMKALLNSHAIIESHGKRMLVAGILDPAAQMAIAGGGPDPKKSLAGSNGAEYPKILLAHQPGIAGLAAELGFQLQLSGHTHAGQFFPWTLIIGRVHEFAKGLGKKASMWVYVNPGTGSWGPPVRLGSRTEITLLSLTREG
jgi:uncharacterized protein